MEVINNGSNESLWYPNQEFDPTLRKGTPLQKSFQKVDVKTGCRKLLEQLAN